MKQRSFRLVMRDEKIVDKIYLIRNRKAMIERHLAELYGVNTKTVKRISLAKYKSFP